MSHKALSGEKISGTEPETFQLQSRNTNWIKNWYNDMRS